MSFDAFLKLDKVPGECADLVHQEWIELLSFAWGVRQPAGTVGTGVGARPERCEFEDFTFSKLLDAASPKLAIACARGDRLREAVLQLHRATGEKQKYYEVKLSQVVVASVKMDADANGSNALPAETVTLSFAKIEWIYTSTDLASGRQKGDVRANWDLESNRGV
jgi:type VI secretion system secreted protein Hcp